MNSEKGKKERIRSRGATLHPQHPLLVADFDTISIMAGRDFYLT